jgi:ubiquinone/menaquinone biosynthesis C-methylase UbiE
MAVDADTDHWVSRWDSMQEVYNPDRRRRLRTLVEVVRAKHDAPQLVLDVGCGTGSVMAELLDAFPSARAVGIDLDFTLLDIARSRLGRFGDRAELVEADLRGQGWTSRCPTEADAVLSATALHWFTSSQLERLYRQFHRLLKKGGVFLNADHVGCEDPQIQEAWDRPRTAADPTNGTTAWQSFWDELLADRSPEERERRVQILGPWVGVEQGLPLEWHFLQLKKAGFCIVDCFYRLGGDAVYGGVK